MLKPIMKSLIDPRVLVLVLPAAFVLCLDLPVAKSLGYSLAVMLVIAGVSHWTRKVAAPYIDLDSLVREARHGNVAAAIVVFAVFMFLSAMIIGTVWWVRG